MKKIKKVILIRSNQIQGDSRVEKYIKFFEQKEIPYEIIAWDRNATGIELNNVYFYRRKVGYLVGGLKAAFNRLFWFKHVISELRKYKKENLFIHACDLDTAYPVALYKKFFNKKAYILFDVFDWMSDDMAGTGLMRKAIVAMESTSLKYSNKVVICEEERKAQIPHWEKYDLAVLPNIPMAEIANNNEEVLDEKFPDDKLVFSYVGYLGHARFLDELLTLAEDGYINLLVAGYGDKLLEERCTRLNEQKDNVKYFGRVPYAKGLSIMGKSDLIYAMYCNVVRNHYYAAPNKFYEPMMLGKPLLTTKGIIIGDKVEKMGFGYTVEEDYNKLVALVKGLSKEDLVQKGQIAKDLWKSQYSTYTSNFLNNIYLPLLES